MHIGKTFLVKELFEGRLAFYATGLLDEGKTAQIRNFNEEIANFGGGNLTPAEDWQSVFSNLNRLIEQSQRPGKKVIFLDEVPWMDTPRSGFLSALDHFWNRWASTRHDVLLIVCGSATSWMKSNLVNNYGGLYNRLTRQIAMAPFTLAECEILFQRKGMLFTRFQMVESYMVFGGIPYYLSLMEPRYSLYQNVDRLYFIPEAPLANEYGTLFRSLFRKADSYIRIVEALAKKGIGLTRKEVATQSGFADGGKLSGMLVDLENNGFIRSYRAFGNRKRGRIYQLIDPFILFHLRFGMKRSSYNDRFWLQFSTTPAYGSWSGVAFERVCLLHTAQIKQGLGVSGVLVEVSSWHSAGHQPGAQIDLVIDRSDKVINLCELKFSSDEYVIDKAYDAILRNKRAAFKAETSTRKGLQTTLITPFGLKKNPYANTITAQLTIDDLFYG
jgi:hypothetical protein